MTRYALRGGRAGAGGGRGSAADAAAGGADFHGFLAPLCPQLVNGGVGVYAMQAVAAELGPVGVHECEVPRALGGELGGVGGHHGRVDGDSGDAVGGVDGAVANRWWQPRVASMLPSSPNLVPCSG